MYLVITLKTKNENINIYQFKTSIYNSIWIGHSNDFMKFIKKKDL